jgi:hypothetical protein
VTTNSMPELLRLFDAIHVATPRISTENPSSSLSVDLRVCSLCGKSSGKRCNRCHKASYCSPTCQRQDWKKHKIHCMKIEKL